ncbi:unnamed protein product [Lymnaea stagnalis]|uniref:Uncharacterized protein n=1 Tax=Lymnaea stagnalis TaxID=6523 RepID=A0AAV2HYB6_LYMST
MIWPELFEDFSSFIPENERSEMIKAFYKHLTSNDQNTSPKAAGHWSTLELATLRPQVDPEYLKSANDEHLCIKLAIIEWHYHNQSL